MKRLPCSAILIILLAITRPALSDEPADDLKRLTGTWRATEGAWRGQELTAKQAQQCILVFHPSRSPLDLSGGPRGMDLRVPDRLVGYEIWTTNDKKETRFVTEWAGYGVSLDTSATPRTLAAFKLIGAKGHGFGGIYRIEEDELTVCLNFDRLGKPPKEFKSPAGLEILLLRLKRSK
jgi:uncharacterized protein (TIGR03067 family)